MSRKKKWIISAAVILLVALIVAASVSSRGSDHTEVEVAKVERTDLVSRVTANGKIEAKRKVDLSAHVMGQIVNLAVREGDVVEKDAFLLQIDKTQLEASAAGAAASLEALLADRAAAVAAAREAELIYERAQKSFSDNLIPRADLERAAASLQTAQANLGASERRIDQARASLAGARDTLSKTTIRSPMSGIVTALPVEEGEVAVIGTMNNPGTILLTISDMSLVEAVMEVDETDIPSVQIGQKAEVTIDAFPGRTFEGIVTEVSSSPRQALGATDAVNFEVKIQLVDPPTDVRPGFSAAADIITGQSPGAVAVPIQALVIRDAENGGGESGGPPAEEEGVYVLDRSTSKIAFQKVETGIAGDTSIEILSGVEPGAEIVIGPFRALREVEDGDQVEVPDPGAGEENGEEEAA